MSNLSLEFSHEEAKNLTDVIVAGLGGWKALKVMTGASIKYFDRNNGELCIKFKGSKKTNTVTVAYDRAKDLFNIQFYRIGPRIGCKKVGEFIEGAYTEDLEGIFEMTTGLSLTVPTVLVRR